MVTADLLFPNNLECFHSELQVKRGSGLDMYNIPFISKKNTHLAYGDSVKRHH